MMNCMFSLFAVSIILSFAIIPVFADTTAPTAPTGVSAAAVSPTQVNLFWTAPSGFTITGYKIEYKTGSGPYVVLVATTGTTTTNYSHTGLTTGASYSYKIYAINSIGTSGPSGESSAVPKETTTPTLTAIAIAPTQIHLSWVAPSQTYKQSINGYKIEEKIGDSYKVIQHNAGSSTKYTISGLVTGKPHTYVVSALFSAGASPRSNEASATPLATSTPPAGFSTIAPSAPTPTPTKPIGNDPQSILKAQQEEVKRKAQEARDAMLKQSGKGDSDKAKAAREEARLLNEKAKSDAQATRQKLIADKKAEVIKKQLEKTTDPTAKQKIENITPKKPKTLEEARKLAQEAKQKALEKANIDAKPKEDTKSKAEQELAAAKAAAWEKARKALEAEKAKKANP